MAGAPKRDATAEGHGMFDTVCNLHPDSTGVDDRLIDGNVYERKTVGS